MSSKLSFDEVRQAVFQQEKVDLKDVCEESGLDYKQELASLAEELNACTNMGELAQFYEDRGYAAMDSYGMILSAIADYK